MPHAIVAHAWVDEPNSDGILARHSECPLVRGIRTKPVTAASPRDSVERRHLNYAGTLHGGVIATLLDVACGYSGLRSVSDSAAGLAATFTLTVSYHAGVTEGTLKALGWVTGGGRSIFFASGKIVAPDGTLVATGQGAFKLSAPRS